MEPEGITISKSEVMVTASGQGLAPFATFRYSGLNATQGFYEFDIKLGIGIYAPCASASNS